MWRMFSICPNPITPVTRPVLPADRRQMSKSLHMNAKYLGSRPYMRFDKVMLDWKVGRDFHWQKWRRGWGKRGYGFWGLLLCSAKRVWPLFKSFLNPPSLSPAQTANTFEAHIILVYRREPIFLQGYYPTTQTPGHTVCLVTLVVASLPDWPLVLLSTLICQE